MALEGRLASELIETHPERAAVVLERLEPELAVEVTRRGSARSRAALLEQLSPARVDAVLAGLDVERTAAILDEMDHAAAARVVRRAAPERREPLLAALPAPTARPLRTALRFPEHSAGALMDPQILALPEELTAKEALARIREDPTGVHYNLYVISEAGRLAGVLNLRELFLARPGAGLRELMVREPQALEAHTDRSRIVAHPGWRLAHALPVVDETGAYLGAVRYRTLRELEEELLRGSRRDAETPEALGQLFAAGANGLLDAIAGAAPAGERS